MSKRRLSIRKSLLIWLIAPLLLVNAVGAGLVYWLAWTPAQTAFDQSLADTGWALSTRLKKISDQVHVDLPLPVEQVLRVDHFNIIYFAIRKLDGHTLAGDKDFPMTGTPSKLDEPVLSDGRMRGEDIRIVSIRFMVDGEHIIINVAETLSKRNAIQSHILIALLILESVMTLSLIAVVWLAVTRGLEPLKFLQQDLNRRSYDELSPIQEDQNALELAAVINAINRLLRKIETGASEQQEFLANIAHQLRTPLAGMKAQIEWLQGRYRTDPETTRSTELMMISTERMIRQINQLLALARAEPNTFERKRLAPVRLEKIIADSIHALIITADRKNIDLGFDLQPVSISGDAFLLRDLIENVIDNAIAYTPQHGVVTVRCYEQQGHSGIFSVEDNGPGIPKAERELIFQRRYRITESLPDTGTQLSNGNGLGLSIVSDIAKDHDASIEVKDAAHGGTVFTILFPSLQPQ